MIRTALVDPTDGTAIETEQFWRGPHSLHADARSILVADAYRSHGVFKAVTFTPTTTVALGTPDIDGSLILTDLIMTGDKVNGGTMLVKFTDDTFDDVLINISTTDAPVAIALAFAGRFQGWANSRVDVIITGNIKGSVVLGYIKAPNGLPYSEWDQLR